jgi:hypothetical protein
MINNLPLRAFPRRGTRGLDPRTVAFNLYEAIDRRSGTTVKSNLARVLREYAGVFMDQPVNSQMELDTDQYQIVRLDTPGLGTFDMIWDERKVPAVIDAATATTRTYFRGSQNLRSERRPECFGVSIQWEKSRPTKKDAIDPQIFEAIARAQFRSYFSVVTPAPVYIVPYINEHRIRSEDYFSIDMIVGTSADPHTWLLIEAKSSPTAPLSAPQRKLHGLVALHGGVLLNKRDYDDEEWSPFVDQSELPARKVTIVTPSNLCAEFKRLAHDARSLYGPFPSARP